MPLDENELQVTTYTSGYARMPRVAAHADGTFLVTWSSDGSPGNDDFSESIQARRFRAGGLPIDPEQLQVNTFTPSIQQYPDVAALRDGGFVVVWESWRGSVYGSSQDVLARRFGPQGPPLDTWDLLINEHTGGAQERPSVAATADGGFVVAWQDGDVRIRARRFRADGGALDPVDLQVNTQTFGLNNRPHVAARPDGGFVVVWLAYDGADGGVWGRRFGEDGSPLEPAEFLVNTYTTGPQYQPRVAVDPDGDFVVAWTSYFSPEDADHYAVRARRFASDGTPKDAADFQVNTFTTGQQGAYTVETDFEGNFVLAWYSSTVAPVGGSTVAGRRFRKDGTAIDAADFILPAYTTGWHGGPSLARTPDGDFVAVWGSQYSLGNDPNASIQMRRFGRPTISVAPPVAEGEQGACSLPDAIEAANTGTAVGGCPPGNEGAVLELAPDASYRFSAPAEGTNALPVVRKPVTIDGHGSRIERDPTLPCPGSPELRLLEVADGGVLTLEDVEISGGCLATAAGGGVLADGGTLVLREAAVAGNSAAGPGGGVAVQDGNLLAFDAAIRDNASAAAGGGLAILGEPGWLRLERSTLAGNSGLDGGALYLASDTIASAFQSTFSGNVANGRGGGVLLDAAGARLTLDHLTLFGNDAPDGDALHLVAGAARLHSSLAGDDDLLDEDDCAATAGTLLATGGNLDTDASCQSLAGGGVATVLSLGLAPLGNQSGPTPTHLPLEGSRALDSDFACRSAAGFPVTADQRSLPRPTDDDGDGVPYCDLGAVERGPIFVDGFESGSTGRWSLAQS